MSRFASPRRTARCVARWLAGIGLPLLVGSPARAEEPSARPARPDLSFSVGAMLWDYGRFGTLRSAYTIPGVLVTQELHVPVRALPPLLRVGARLRYGFARGGNEEGAHLLTLGALAVAQLAPTLRMSLSLDLGIHRGDRPSNYDQADGASPTYLFVGTMLRTERDLAAADPAGRRCRPFLALGAGGHVDRYLRALGGGSSATRTGLLFSTSVGVRC